MSKHKPIVSHVATGPIYGQLTTLSDHSFLGLFKDKRPLPTGASSIISILQHLPFPLLLSLIFYIRRRVEVV